MEGSNEALLEYGFPKHCLFITFVALPSLQEKIESATDVLKAILKPVVDEEEEITWPPRDPEALVLMQKVGALT